MAKRKKSCGCPCKVGAPKSACGLKGLRACGPSCSCGPCRASRGAGGLRGTVAQHRARAEKLLGEARTELADGECLSALSTAAQAEAEADWLPGGYGPGTLKRKTADLANRARDCVSRRGYKGKHW